MTRPTRTQLPLHEAMGRLRADHELLAAQAGGLTVAELAAPFETAAGPLGDFCQSLHDLVAHVLMWDEISLAVLSEAAAGRAHWSLDPRWETPQAGRLLNEGGVLAGRLVPADLLWHRLRAVHGAILAALDGYDETAWAAPRGEESRQDTSMGALVQAAWTVPGQPAFWHAAIHLRRLPATATAATAASTNREGEE
jgi:hypothetical protein